MNTSGKRLVALYLHRSGMVQGWAIAHFENVRLLFFKCNKKVRSHTRTFVKSDRKCNRTIAFLKRSKMCDVRMCDCPTLVWSLICMKFCIKILSILLQNHHRNSIQNSESISMLLHNIVPVLYRYLLKKWSKVTVLSYFFDHC